MNTDTRRKKKKTPHRGPSHLGVILIVTLAVVILVVNVLSFSYSWFTPKQVTAKSMSFEAQSTLRSENCDFKTYQGEIVTAEMKESNATKYANYSIDQIRYDDNYIADNAVISVPKATTTTVDGKTVTTPGRVYFRTNIQNNDTKYPSVVSLYHENMPADLYCAVTYPSNTFHFVGSLADIKSEFGNTATGWPDYFIIRNAYVKVKDMNDADGPGLLSVEWFVENRTDSDIPIRVTPYTHTVSGNSVTDVMMYLMYN